VPNPARRELNERLDEQKDRYVQQAEVALREQEEKLSAGAGLLPPQPTDDDYEELGAALEGEAAPGSLPEEEPGRPHDSHAARYIGGAVVRQEQQGAGAADAAAAEPAAGLDEGVGAEAQLRYQKARLQVLEEELQKARGDAASTASKLQAAETQLKEAQQQRAKLERHEKSVAAALEREKLACAEQRQRAETFERELSLLRKEMDEAGRGQRNALGELRGKDVRLNRALEELEKYRTQLREMREARDGAGHDARADAQRLAAENARLRKRQSDLILAFKKQAKLIDVLKRQKLHVEAARMLSFTEEEFSKTLELGEQLAA
jgi:chromosome segregation ATPase